MQQNINLLNIKSDIGELFFFCITGTTEKIFEVKTSLYDIYVDNQIIKPCTPMLKDLLKVSDADRDKFTKLNNQR